MIKKKKESGQALVEFALILPILMVILCGILDFGWIYYNKYKVEDAAYEGARFASIAVEDSGVGDTLTEDTKQRVRQNLPNHGKGANITVTTGSGQVSVTVTYPVRNLTFVGWTVVGEYYYATSTSVASI